MFRKYSHLDWHTIKYKWQKSGKTKKAFYDSDFDVFCANTNKPSLPSFYHYLEKVDLEASDANQLPLLKPIVDTNSSEKQSSSFAIECSANKSNANLVVSNTSFSSCSAVVTTSTTVTDASCVNFSNFTITLVTCPVDIRADFNKLAKIARANLNINLYERKDLVVFVSKTRQIAKIAGCDISGEILLTKRLKKGRFQQIYSKALGVPAEVLSVKELQVYLQGLNIRVKRSNFVRF